MTISRQHKTGEGLAFTQITSLLIEQPTPISISWDEKSLIHKSQPQRLLPNPERFDLTVCVLGSEGFPSEKHYWEVDVGTSTDWDLRVARKSIQRKGKLSFSPREGFWVMAIALAVAWQAPLSQPQHLAERGKPLAALPRPEHLVECGKPLAPLSQPERRAEHSKPLAPLSWL
ncbi:butyrophilin subfamily 3 member A1-like [Gopherus flavomarginatus]|uniref:butyrophilin subfamily 3 member A1-like n=1 Tax=Gopherus flavomarginatus TaxID=286002 RepID=UPI0021CBCB68|nr:butyrophilin subfamily 3 member A1-like [Gopherus flavomarginatus]